MPTLVSHSFWSDLATAVSASLVEAGLAPRKTPAVYDWVHGRYLGSRPDRPLGCVSQKMQAAMEEAVKGAKNLPTPQLRHCPPRASTRPGPA